MPKMPSNNPVETEKQAELEAEAMAVENSEPSAAEQNIDEEAEKALVVEEGADAETAMPAEVAAIHTDNESAKAVNKKVTKEKPKKAEGAKTVKKTGRSAKYKEARVHVETGRLYPLDEVIELVKKTSYSKFDGGVELHLKLTKKKAKGSTESSKGVFQLPHGSGKERVVIVLDEAKIEAIAKTKKIDFDVALASPELMPKVAKIAKILGPKGKMPDPKSGTVTTDTKKTIEEINSGKVEYRIDASNNLHQLVGKVSWDGTKLAENIQAILSSMPKSKIAAAYVTASMSPSVALDLSGLK